MGQRLHVLHQGRRAAQAALAHPRRLERGQRGAAADTTLSTFLGAVGFAACFCTVAGADLSAAG